MDRRMSSVTEANMKNFLRHASKGDTITIN